jgi:hypothetical protein
MKVYANFTSTYDRYFFCYLHLRRKSMFKQSRFVFLTVTLLLVFFVSLARPMAAYADDSTPPPPTEEPANPPTEEAPVETESAPAEAPSEPSATETPTEPATESEPVAVSEILEAAPEGTEVVVLDENSEVVSLASAEAAEIVATTDPMWCPVGVQPGGAGCTINFATPQALIDAIDAADPGTTNSIFEQDGIIYFTADPGGAFVLTSGGGTALSSGDYSALKQFSLTLQGGWNGVSGAGSVISGQTNFGANRVQIGSSGNPWAGNITINNISINGVVDNVGLIVYTAGNINLNSVDSQNNTGTTGNLGNGAYLNNCALDSGTGLCTGSGNVNVNSSSFNNNTQNGLRVVSNGSITLSGVTADSNAKRGTQLENTTGSGNIDISSSTFNGNGTGGIYRGIDAHSNGNITLLNVIAGTGNTSDGALLDNSSGSGVVSVTSSSFSGNDRRGLDVLSNQNITLFGVITGENTFSGTRLDNRTGSGSLSVSDSSFNGNGVDGLDAYSNGDITLANVIANFNAEIGASLVNDSGEGNVSVSNGTFNSNTSIQGLGQNLGLEIISNGDVTLDTVTANDNTGTNGSSIVGGGVLVQNSIFNNNDNGLYLEADEAEVVCSQFNNNAGYGIDGLNVFVLFTLDDVVFSGNGSGDYAGSPVVTTGGCSAEEGGGEEGGGEEGGSEEEPVEGEEDEGEGGGDSSSSNTTEIIPLTGLALNIVLVAGSENVNLNCEAFSGTKLVLPNGDSLILPCPIRDEGTLIAQAQDGLPGLLDDQFGFLSAMNTGVIRDGQALSMVDTGMIVEFVIPDGQNAENLAILHWDGSKWAEFPGSVTADGYFAVTTNFTGVFVLVTK